jgi:hypothetical protein
MDEPKLRCARCQLPKPFAAFPRDRSKSKGKQSACFTCGREVARARYLKKKIRDLLAPGTRTAPAYVYEDILADRSLFACPNYKPRKSK